MSTAAPGNPAAGRHSGGPSFTRRRFIGGIMAVTAGAVLGRTAGAPRWQIGCFTRPWAEFDFRVALDGIAAAGFAFAGLMTAKGGKLVTPDTTPGQIALMGAEAKARNLSILSIYGDGFIREDSVAESIVRLKRLVDNAALCGCPTLLLGGMERAGWRENYCQVIARCCDHAAERGVGLVIKPHGGFNATGPQCRRLIEEVGHRNFRLWYDPGNICYYSEGRLDPVEDAASVDGVTTGMCVKDFRPPREVDLTPGTGTVGFAKVLARLKRGGFAGGPLVIECLSPGNAAAITAEAEKSRRFVEALVAENVRDAGTPAAGRG
ncbi:MAG: sugar phosphate isomerase/epimerase [Opitutae bacterium]|nr:sugar phosphate isomerase/epimerase [Opitutae bacterium]